MTTHTDDCGYCDPRIFYILPPTTQRSHEARIPIGSFRSPEEEAYAPCVSGEIPR